MSDQTTTELDRLHELLSQSQKRTDAAEARVDQLTDELALTRDTLRKRTAVVNRLVNRNCICAEATR